MRKRIFLVFCLIFLPITILAFENTSKNVIVGDVEGSDDVIDIKFDWSNLKFIYNYQTNYIWNNETHKYEITKKEFWDDTKGTIKVVNNSTKSINLIPKYTGNLNVINGSFNSNLFNLEPKKNKNVIFTISGKLPKSYKEYTKAGTITLQFE